MKRNYVVTAREMRNYDNNTINIIGIPSCVLMERAALAAATMIETDCKHIKGNKYVLIMAGMGNNGGDGLAVGRMLTEKGYHVEVWLIGNQEKASAQWKQQMGILEHYPVEITEKPKRQAYTILVDALFGVGLSREVTGSFEEAITLFNKLEGYKLALDVPSGVESDQGKILGCAVKADRTITFGFCKRGLILYPGCECAGEVKVADIGISKQSFMGTEPGMFALEGDISELLPKRRKDGNKGTFGKILLAAGSENMAGAAVLAAKAAYRTGAGMVKVITHPQNRTILQERVPEALFGTYEHLEEGMAWADVIAIGPGIGKGESALSSLKTVIMESRKPLLIDADGLNLLAIDQELEKILAKQGAEGREIILTPHIGELSRLSGKSIAQCKQNPVCYAMELATQLLVTVVSKDARTVICHKDFPVCINRNGNDGMATAGSGDVLAGVIASLLAQGMKAFEGACVGVYLHGMAGDMVTAKSGAYFCMAGDIAEAAGICCNMCKDS